MLETLVQPLRQNNQSLIAAYETLLTETDIKLVPINLTVLRQAADLRAVQNIKTPDAIHASTAIHANCPYFVTNDNGFKRLSNFNVIVLSEII